MTRDDDVVAVAEWLNRRGGDVEAFREYLSRGHRLGQAFFNALGEEARNKLRATPFDPYYFDEIDKVAVAMDRLVDD